MCMPGKKKPEDAAESAHRVLARIIEISEREPEKNPAAVALGRLGGLKGGKARAAKLSKKRRSEIARKAAQARWEKKQ